MRRSELLERNRPKHGAYVVTLRTLLRLTNVLLALLGLAMLGYAVYMYLKFKGTEFPSSQPALSPGNAAGLLGPMSAAPQAYLHPHSLVKDNPPVPPEPAPPPQTLPPPPPPPPAPSHKLAFPWFIFAFGAAGAFTFLAAATGLAGVAWNSRALLGVYSVLLVLMLLVQAAVAVALFADSSWRKYLPPDPTGEFKRVRIEHFVRSKLEVCRWVGLAVLLVQLISLGLAYMLSAAQQKLLEVSDDEDDEVWGRRVPLLSSDEAAAGASASERGEGGRRDPWSARMRDKYGLDTSQFSYNPERAAPGSRGAPSAQLPRSESAREQRRCAVM